MVNLSTVYGVSIVLGSLAAVASAFVGTKVYPIQSGGDPLAGATALAATVTGAFAAAEKAIAPKPEPLNVETIKETPEPSQEEVPPPVEETPAPVEETPAPVEETPPVSGGKRRLPPWFKH